MALQPRPPRSAAARGAHLDRDGDGARARAVVYCHGAHRALRLELLRPGLRLAQLLGRGLLRRARLAQLRAQRGHDGAEPLALGRAARPVHVHLRRARLRAGALAADGREHALPHPAGERRLLCAMPRQLRARARQLGAHACGEGGVRALGHARRARALEHARLHRLRERGGDRGLARAELVEESRRVRRNLLRAPRAARRRASVARRRAGVARLGAEAGDAHAREEGVGERLLRVEPRLRVVAEQPRHEVDRIRGRAGREHALPPEPRRGRHKRRRGRA